MEVPTIVVRHRPLLSRALAVNRQQVLRLHLRQLRHHQHHLPIIPQHQHLQNKQIAQAF